MNALNALAETARNFGIPLSPLSLQLAEGYITLLAQRNAVTNLTAETAPEALYLRHLADGFPAAAFLKKRLSMPAPRLADLGSGGGFIGFGVKLAWPEAEVTLIESLQRKYDFLNVAAARSGLKGLRVIKARAGMGNVPAAAFDAVVERALAPLPEAVALAVPLLKPGGLFVAYQSEPPDLQAPALAAALRRAGASFVDMMPYRLPREDKDRTLAAFRRGD